jgi:hypothetical protein
MAITLGEAILYLRGDGSGLDKSLRDADSNARGVIGGLTNFANTGFTGLKKAVGVGLVAGIGAATAGIAALGAGLVGAVRAGSDVEEMMGKFSIVFANTGGRVTDQLDEFGRAVGRNKYELREMAATFGDTLKPMGFAESDAADLSVTLSKLAVDLGSFNNMDTDEALRRLQGTLIGSHENALAFGVVINENTLKAEMAANGWDKLTGAELEQAKVQARINLLMKGTTDAQGDAARTSGGWANQMRRLQSVLQETQAEIGTKLLPVLTPLLTKLGDLATQYAPQAIAAFVDILDKVVAMTVALLSWDTAAIPFLGTLTDMAGRIMEMVQPVMDAIGSFVSWQDVLIALGVVVAAVVLPILAGIVSAALPIIAVGAALVGAVALVRNAWENDWNGIRELVGGVIDSVLGAYQGFVDGTLTLPQAIGQAFSGIGAAIAERLPGWIETLKGWGAAAWQWVVDSVPVVLGKLGEWATSLITGLAAGLPGFLAGIYEWATAIVSWIGEAIPKAIDSLTNFIENLGSTGDGTGESTFVPMVAKWVGLLIDWVVNDLIPKVGPAFLEFSVALIVAFGKIGIALGELALTIGNTVLQSLLDGMKEGWGAAAWQWVVDSVPVVLGKLGEWATSLITGLAAGLPGFLAGIYEWATAIVSWIGEAIPKAIDSLTNFIENLGSTGDGTGESTFVPMVAKWVGLLIDWVVNDLIPKVGPAFLEFSVALIVAFGKIGIALGELALTIGNTVLQSLLDGMKEGWGAAAWQWVVDSVPVVLGKLGEWATSLITGLAAGLPGFLAGIYEWATAIVSWIGEAIPKAIDSLTNFIENLGSTGDGTGESTFVPMVAKWVGLLIDWVVNDLIPKVGPAFLEFSVALIVAFGKIGIALGELALTIGNTVLQSLLDGMKEGWNSVTTWFGGLRLPNLNPFSNSIPGFATGTNFAPGGMALVGESGPELVSLPRGSRVDNASRTAQQLGAVGSEINITINNTFGGTVDSAMVSSASRSGVLSAMRAAGIR